MYPYAAKIQKQEDICIKKNQFCKENQSFGWIRKRPSSSVSVQ